MLVVNAFEERSAPVVGPVLAFGLPCSQIVAPEASLVIDVQPAAPFSKSSEKNAGATFFTRAKKRSVSAGRGKVSTFSGGGGGNVLLPDAPERRVGFVFRFGGT